MSQNETSTSTVLLNGEQAKNELAEIEIKAKSLRKSMKEALEVGDLKGWNKYKKDLADVNKSSKALKVEAFDAKKVLDDLSGSSVKDLESALKKIQSLMKNGTIKRHSKEWDELKEAQIRVKKEIKNVNAEMSIGESKWAKFTGGFKMFAGLAIGGAILSGLKSWYNSMVEFGTAVSQLSAITGATGKDLDFLKNKAKELGAEYGKSATEIVEAMKLVGSAKPELLENAAALSDMTESVLVLAKASGMELSDTTQSLATIMNQFGLSASEANRVINTLAAGSKYGAVEVDYLSDSIAKVGAVAASAGLNLEQTVSVMELFGEKGIKAEIAGTGLKSLLVELQKDTRNYTNGVFDLNKAIDNNQNIAGNNIKLTEKFGKEYFNLAQILFQNKERFIELNEQVKSTNTAFEQYAVATDNLRGDMDKLTGSWNAFILSLEDGKGPIANAFRSLIQYINEAVGGMERLSKDSNQRKASSTSKIVDIRIDSFKKELPKEKNQIEYINQEIVAEKNLIKRKAERIEYIKKDIEERERLGGAWDDNNDKFQAELDGLQLAKDRSIAYVNALGGLRAEMTKVNKVIDETEIKEVPEDKLTVQKQKVDDAMQALENENLKKITSIKKQYIDGDIASEIEYNETLLDNQEKYDGIRRKKLNELLKTITDPGLKLELNKQIADIDKKALDRQIDQNKKIKKIILDADPIEQEKESHENRLRELGLFGLSKENMTAEQLETLRILEEQHSENMRKLSTKQAIADLKQLEKDQQSEEMLLSAERLKTQMDEQSYKDKLIEIEVRYLRKKLAIQGLSADEIDRIMKQLNQRLIEGADKASQDMASFLNKYGLDELGEFKVRKELELKLLQKYLDDGIVKEKHAARIRAILASEEFQAKTQDFKTQADAIAKTSSDFSSAFQGFQQAEEKAIETRYQKEIDAASKAGKDTTKLEAAKNKELAELRAENADAMFALQAAMIISSTAVSAIDAYASALKVPVIGLVLAPIAAAAAVAYGGSQLAQANAAREAAKEGYYHGGFHDDPDGFTGGTNPREVRGRFADGSPVHGLEYVADHVTTANPTFRKIFNLAEYAKKTNTVARISDRDIMQIMNSSRGFYEGGYHTSNQTNGNQTTTIDLSAIDETIRQTNAINALLLAEIKKGIVAKARISGNDGIAKGIEDYNKLVKNAKG